MAMSIRTILCPTALGSRWEQVLEYAVGLAKRYDANIVVVHAIEPLNPTTRNVVDNIWKEGTVERIREEGIKRLQLAIEARLKKFFETSPEASADDARRVEEIVVEEGFPAPQIIARAERHRADVIVMGTHEHSLVGQLIGSVAHKVVHKTLVPVLLVPLGEAE